MKLKRDENLLVVSNKKRDLDEVLNSLVAKDSKKVAAFLVENASLPREIRIGALRLVLNDYVKIAKELVLSDEFMYRLNWYEKFSEYQLVNFWNVLASNNAEKFDVDKETIRFKKTFYLLLLMNADAVGFVDKELLDLLKLRTINSSSESFAEFMNESDGAFYDYVCNFDGMSYEDFKTTLKKCSTVKDIRNIAAKYDINVPKRLKKDELVAVVLDGLRRQGKATEQTEEELKKMSAISLQRYAKVNGVKASTEMKKDDIIEFIMNRIESSPKAVHKPRIILDTLPELEEFKFSKDYLREVNVVFDEDGDEEVSSVVEPVIEEVKAETEIVKEVKEYCFNYINLLLGKNTDGQETIAVSKKKRNLDEVLNSLVAKDSKKVAAFLVANASLPREIRIGALRLVLNDYVKIAKELVLSDEFMYRLNWYEKFSEYQLVNFWNVLEDSNADKFDTNKETIRFKKTFYLLLLINAEVVGFDDNDLEELLKIKAPKGANESFAEFMNEIDGAFYDYEYNFDGISYEDFKTTLKKCSTVKDIRNIAAKYDINVPKRLKKDELVAVVLDGLRRQGKATEQTEEELKKMSAISLQRYAKVNGVKASTEMKKDDVIEYIMNRIESSPKAVRKPRIILETLPELKEFKFSKDYLREVNVVFDEDSDEEISSVAEPVVEPTVEPTVEAVVEETPVVETIVEEVSEVVVEPVVEPTVEPVVEETPVVVAEAEPEAKMIEAESYLNFIKQLFDRNEQLFVEREEKTSSEAERYRKMAELYEERVSHLEELISNYGTSNSSSTSETIVSTEVGESQVVNAVEVSSVETQETNSVSNAKLRKEAKKIAKANRKEAKRLKKELISVIKELKEKVKQSEKIEKKLRRKNRVEEADAVKAERELFEAEIVLVEERLASEKVLAKERRREAKLEKKAAKKYAKICKSEELERQLLENEMAKVEKVAIQLARKKEKIEKIRAKNDIAVTKATKSKKVWRVLGVISFIALALIVALVTFITLIDFDVITGVFAEKINEITSQYIPFLAKGQETRAFITNAVKGGFDFVIDLFS